MQVVRTIEPVALGAVHNKIMLFDTNLSFDRDLEKECIRRAFAKPSEELAEVRTSIYLWKLGAFRCFSCTMLN